MKKPNVKLTLIIITIILSAITQCISINARALNPGNTNDASMASYYAVKIGDVENTAKATPAIAKGYYQYNGNNSYSENGLIVGRGVVNILFVANCWSDGSYKWLNDAHTKIQVCFGGKKFIFTDGSRYYTSNGKKKPLTVAFATKVKPKANYRNSTGGGGRDITDSRYINIYNASDKAFFERSLIDSGLHDKIVEVPDRIFSAQYLNVPMCMLLAEGFIVSGANTGLDNGETVMYIPQNMYRKASLSFSSSNKITAGSTMTVNYRDQFNSLPADIRKIAVKNYNAATLKSKPFQTKFKGKSNTTAAKAAKAEKKYAAIKYYGDQTTTHGVDISFAMAPTSRDSLYGLFNTLGLPRDFADWMYKNGINGDWQYEYNQKKVQSYKSSNGKTYKYVLGRLEGISKIQLFYTVNILVPGHPAMPGEYFEGAFYKSSAAGNLTEDAPAKDLGTREDFYLNYQLPNDVRTKMGLPKISGNVSTWTQWKKAYNGDKKGLIKSAYKMM